MPSSLASSRRVPWLLLAACLALLPGCAVGRYCRDRALDLTDVLDLKYGTCIGVGAKVEITQFLGVGGGAAALGVQREWYGRRSISSKGFAFFHVGVFGVDGGFGSANPDGWSDEPAEVYFLLVNGTAFADFLVAPGGTAEIDTLETGRRDRALGHRDAVVHQDEPAWPPTPPLVDRWRVGFEVLLPGGGFGLYLNFGELFDFLIGWTTIDIADDDGVGKGALYATRPRITEPELIVW